LEIEHGGWCPRGRRAEDGPIAEDYLLQETSSPKYAVRTEQNVVDSDGTLILYRDQLAGGTLLTQRLANKHQRPLLTFDLTTLVDEADDEGTDAAKTRVLDWLTEHSIAVLNIAGPRESTCQGINLQANHFLAVVFSAYCRWRAE
jgi:hypothetical protein